MPLSVPVQLGNKPVLQQSAFLVETVFTHLIPLMVWRKGYFTLEMALPFPPCAPKRRLKSTMRETNICDWVLINSCPESGELQILSFSCSHSMSSFTCSPGSQLLWHSPGFESWIPVHITSIPTPQVYPNFSSFRWMEWFVILSMQLAEMLQEVYLSRMRCGNSAELLSLCVCLPRLPSSRPEDSSFLYSLPDDSTHQLLQPQDDCPHLQERFVGLHHPVMGNKVGGSSLDPRRDPLFHHGE